MFKLSLKYLLILLLLATISCSSALKRNEVDSWLNTKAANKSAEINIKGKWIDADYDFPAAKYTPLGWGEGYINQNENKIEGNLGNYNVFGIVSGKTVFFVLLSGGAVYYTVRMEMAEDNMLRGNYFYPKDKQQFNGYPMSLKKVQ